MDLDKFFSTAGGYTFMQPIHIKDGGETIKQLFSRCMKLVNKLLKKHQGKNILVVTHGDPLMALVYGLVDKDLRNYFKKTREYLGKGTLVEFIFENNKLVEYKQIIYEQPKR